MLGATLSILGHQVCVVHDGRAAMGSGEKFAPDVALLDIGLSDMTGYELAQRIRATAWGKDLHLIAATGWGQVADKLRAHESGFDVHLTKPIELSDLQAALAALLDKRA